MANKQQPTLQSELKAVAKLRDQLKQPNTPKDTIKLLNELRERCNTLQTLVDADDVRTTAQSVVDIVGSVMYPLVDSGDAGYVSLEGVQDLITKLDEEL